MTTMFTEKINIKELEETLANSTALLAIVGAGDLAWEKFCAARIDIAGRAASFDAKAARAQAQASLAGGVESLQSELKSAPERIQGLPEKAQELPAWAQEWPAKAQALVADVLSTAFTTYGELAGRGKERVTHARGASDAASHGETGPVSRPTTATTKSPGESTSNKTTAKKPTAKKVTAKKSASKKAAASAASTPSTENTASTENTENTAS